MLLLPTLKPKRLAPWSSFGVSIENYIITILRNFYSCSADGKVIQWTIVQTFLRFSVLFEINFTENITNVPKEMDTMRDGATVLSICPASKVEKM